MQKAATGTQVSLLFVWWVPDGLLVQRVIGFDGCENIFDDFVVMYFKLIFFMFYMDKFGAHGPQKLLRARR